MIIQPRTHTEIQGSIYPHAGRQLTTGVEHWGGTGNPEHIQRPTGSADN